ncbi:hypothetical protein [Candidatus Hodarchaeum mangrovi]
MSDEYLLTQLGKLNFEITPSALEIFKNSHIPTDDLIRDILKSGTTENRLITVKTAINILLTSRKVDVISREIALELKEKITYVEVPRRLNRTFLILKRLNDPVQAGNIAQITHRKKETEKKYLEQLFKLNYINKKEEKGKILYMLK